MFCLPVTGKSSWPLINCWGVNVQLCLLGFSHVPAMPVQYNTTIHWSKTTQRYSLATMRWVFIPCMHVNLVCFLLDINFFFLPVINFHRHWTWHSQLWLCVSVGVSRVFLDCLINPLQEQMEEWKRVANTLDKDHAKGTNSETHTYRHVDICVNKYLCLCTCLFACCCWTVKKTCLNANCLGSEKFRYLLYYCYIIIFKKIKQFQPPYDFLQHAL